MIDAEELEQLFDMMGHKPPGIKVRSLPPFVCYTHTHARSYAHAHTRTRVRAYTRRHARASCS
jgi:hypothetical protein